MSLSTNAVIARTAGILTVVATLVGAVIVFGSLLEESHEHEKRLDTIDGQIRDLQWKIVSERMAGACTTLANGVVSQTGAQNSANVTMLLNQIRTLCAETPAKIQN